MITSGDDYLLHQVAEPIRHAGSSDRNFYDRYYFNAHDRTGDLFCIFGLGQYPNLGTTDAFFGVSLGEEQHVVRASRELGDRLDTSVGPIRVEVIEPLRELRFVCDHEHAACDLHWEGVVEPLPEPRMFERRHGRVIFDTQRFVQTGRWTGMVRVGNRIFDVDPDTWWGSRDRSWGIRPVGEPEPMGITAKTYAEGFGFYWVLCHVQFPDHTILCLSWEDGRGRRLLTEGLLARPESDPEPLGHLEVELSFVSGTRLPSGGVLRFPQADLEIAAESLRTFYLFAGTGYGGPDGWRHGAWQGELKVEGVTIDLSTPEQRADYSGLHDQLARFSYDGGTGYGLFETGLFGRVPSCGFEDWGDVAP